MVCGMREWTHRAWPRRPVFRGERDMTDMRGRVAIVTGAASGIGRATALAFARSGARVVAADIDAAGGEETVRIIGGEGGQGIFRPVDVTVAGDVSAVIQAAIATFGAVDFAANVAGIEGNGAYTADADEAVFDRVLGVNLKGTW